MIIIVLLIKLIYMLRIQEKQNINILLTNEKIQRFNDFKVFIERSSDIDNIYKNIEQNNTNKKSKILIVFDFMIADILSNKKLNLIVTELFIRGRKFSLDFIAQSYFAVTKILD